MKSLKHLSNKDQLILSNEVSRCLLCHEAACTKACGKGQDPGRGIRALRFASPTAAGEVWNKEGCEGCLAPCQSACIHYDKPLRIQEMGCYLPKTTVPTKDLSIDFCGVRCENPFFLSSSIVANGYDMIARAFDMGWSGMVYKTIGFYKPQEVSPRFDATQDWNRSFAGFKNLEQISEKSVEENMAILKKLKENYPTKVIVSSIMGQNEQEWEELARLSQEAKADIIECNFSCPHMSEGGLGSDVGQNPEMVAAYTRATRRGTTLPILAKMTPNISHMSVPARAAMEAGADGLAAINTIKSISSIDHRSLCSKPDVQGKSAVSGYSGRSIKPIALRFICEMAQDPQLKGAPISGMGGIETFEDVLDFMTLGCGNIQITTSVMEYGYRIIDDLISGMCQYMEEQKIVRLEDVVGSALENVISADHLDRSTIVYPTFSKKDCIGCKRCYLSCADAGHQAIETTETGVQFQSKKCVGCHLCRLVCPAGAIGSSKRVECPQD